MPEATYQGPKYKVSFTLAYGGRRFARLGPLPEAGDDIPALTQVLDHLSFTDYAVKTETQGAYGSCETHSSPSHVRRFGDDECIGWSAYAATASVIVFGRTSANYAHALACDLRIPVSYVQLAEVAS